eukprot:1978707-Amphidinium_carterae.1
MGLECRPRCAHFIASAYTLLWLSRAQKLRAITRVGNKSWFRVSVFVVGTHFVVPCASRYFTWLARGHNQSGRKTLAMPGARCQPIPCKERRPAFAPLV